MKPNLFHLPARTAARLSGLASIGLAASILLSACGTHTVVMVRDTDQTAYAGRRFGHYGYPQSVTSDGKDTVYSAGSPRRLGAKVSDVRTGDVVTEQMVGAYVDPANPNLLHQPHVVMRLDERARWRLAPAADADVLHGPVAGLRRKEYSPVATRGEAGREIMATRRTNEQMMQAASRVQEQQVSMANAATQNQQALLNNQAKLLQLNDGLKRRMESLETRQQQQQRTPGGSSSGVPLTTPYGTSSTEGKATPPPMTSQQTVSHGPDNNPGVRPGVYEGSSN